MEVFIVNQKVLNDDGSVRQYWETITNNKDITVAFDGLYKRVE